MKVVPKVVPISVLADREDRFTKIVKDLLNGQQDVMAKAIADAYALGFEHGIKTAGKS